MDIRRTCQFLLDKERGKQDAKLRYRIKWDHNRRIVAFNVGYRVDIDKWSTDTQRCRVNTTHGKKKVPASRINREIQRYEGIIEEVFTDFERLGHMPTPDEVRDAVHRKTGSAKKSRATMFDIMDEFISETGQMNSWTDNTYKMFGVVKRHLQDFNPNLKFSDLNEHGLAQLVEYYRDVRGLRNVTVGKQLGFVKWFLRWASSRGYNREPAYETFSPKLKTSERKIIFLDWDELMRIYNYTIPEDGTATGLKDYCGNTYTKTVQHSATLEKVRDVFCFSCFTSLRYSDVANLRASDIFPDYISVTTKKTADSIRIELNRYSRAILEKYRDFRIKEGRALPVMSNQKMNGYLKELCELCGINKPVTVTYYKGSERIDEVHPKFELVGTHAGRRTFICNALMMGIPPQVVMKWTGHCDYQSMKPYIDITDRAKADAMKLFDK